MGISADDIERVRAASNLVEIVQRNIQLRRVGRRWVGLCPFHAEKTPSFNVNEELGLYRCWGCGAKGDVITFVQQTENTDFVGAVESLAGKAGITLTYTGANESHDRQARRKLVDAVQAAVDWYHERLLKSPDAGPARSYLRSRGIGGDLARQFKLGWAPDDWDALCKALKLPTDVLTNTNLGFVNRVGKQQDTFRARLLFPIFNEQGEAVAFGGRVMPGAEGPKYKNSQETRVYQKSKTLYGLNWAKASVVERDEIVVCEGYTDVMGFFQAGVPRAVATCGTALTEDHVRLMRKFARRVVLAFDADSAGQGAADRFYGWEQQYEVSVFVAALPQGADPADLARTDPDALALAVKEAKPFLGYRVERVLAASPMRSPEERARAAEAALAMVNEHPNAIVRREYAGQIAARCNLPIANIVAMVENPSARPRVETPSAPRRRAQESTPEISVLRLLLDEHYWDEIAEYLIEELFADHVNLAAFRALADAGPNNVHKAIEVADPEAADLLTRLAVEDVDATDPLADVMLLIHNVVRRELGRLEATRDIEVTRITGRIRPLLHQLDESEARVAAATELLGWLTGRGEEGAVHDE
ncbi:MAG: DNA primase [Acidimicrobiia bacterium]